jgi:hypothetical protein
MAKKKEQKHIPVVTKKSLEFFEKYINNPSPTGFEWEGQRMWLDYIKPYTDEYMVDNYGTAVAVINPKAEFKVVIEAHADEISWFVNYITKDGLIYVIKNGGSDHQIAPSKGLIFIPIKELSRHYLAGQLSIPVVVKRKKLQLKKYFPGLRMHHQRRG